MSRPEVVAMREMSESRFTSISAMTRWQQKLLNGGDILLCDAIDELEQSLRARETELDALRTQLAQQALRMDALGDCLVLQQKEIRRLVAGLPWRSLVAFVGKCIPWRVARAR